MRPRALYPNCRFSDKGDMCPAAYDVNNQCPQADLDFCPTNVKAMSPGCANSDPFGITATQLGGFDQFIDVNKVEAMFLDSAGTPIGEADASACVDGDLQTTCSVETTHAPTGLRVTTGIDVPVLVRAVALYPADGYQVRRAPTHDNVTVLVLICWRWHLLADLCLLFLLVPPLLSR